MTNSFLTDLFDERLLVPTGTAGLHASGATFERIVSGIGSAVGAVASDGPVERLQFPPMMNRADFERSGYARGFSDRVGSIHCFCGDADLHRDLVRKHDRRQDWTTHMVGSDLVLTPSACYPVYPAMAARGPLPQEGLTVEVCSYCFRREWAEDQPARLQSFRMLERVFIGPESSADAFRQRWTRQLLGLADLLGLHARIEDANDPFFGEIGPFMAERQRVMALKQEMLVEIDGRPVACASVNSHLTKMSDAWDLRLPGGGRAHTACVGFGLERLAMALIDRHGTALGDWPRTVTDALFGTAASPQAVLTVLRPRSPGDVASRSERERVPANAVR